MKFIKGLFFNLLGILLIGVGMAGVVLPILPGWVFIFMGLSIIAPRAAIRLRRWLFRRRFKKDIFLYTEWRKVGAEAGYTTRHFPLCLSKTEDLLREENQTDVARYFSADPAVQAGKLQRMDRFAFIRQVHGDNIVILEDALKFKRTGFYPQESADGILTCVPGLTLLVFSADCLPIFYSAGDWVGLVHAGWRGTKAEIAVKMLKLISESSGVPASKVRTIFGPYICPDCYKVGEEFAEHNFSKDSVYRRRGKLHFDLGGENRHQLTEAGVSNRRVLDHGICTFEENADFYSFRKEGDKAGRLISFITKL